MADDFPRDRPHLTIAGGGLPEPYRRRNQKIDSPPVPLRDRAVHAAALEAAIGVALAEGRRQLAERDEGLATGTPGFYLDIEVPAGEQAVIDQLADRRKKMEVVAVSSPAEAGGAIIASVFVPTEAADFYLKKVEDYRTEDTPKGRPKNEPLVSRMETVRLATARSLFTDAKEHFPQDAHQRVWWEVWLREGRREAFERSAKALNLGLRPHAVKFPEREVVLALSSTVALDRLLAHSDVVAELRRAKDTPAFFRVSP